MTFYKIFEHYRSESENCGKVLFFKEVEDA
jgi:hypothetical protein